MNSNDLHDKQCSNWSENTWSTIKEHGIPITFPYVRPDKLTGTVTFFCPISVTYNALMLIEMLLLCYAARYVYYVDLEREEETATVEATDRTKDKSTEQENPANNNETNKQPSELTAWDFLLRFRRPFEIQAYHFYPREDSYILLPRHHIRFFKFYAVDICYVCISIRYYFKKSF